MSLFGHCKPPCRHRHAKTANIKRVNSTFCQLRFSLSHPLRHQHALLGITRCHPFNCPGRHNPWPTGADIPGHLRIPRKCRAQGFCIIVTARCDWRDQYALDILGFSGGGLTLDKDACLCLSGIPNFMNTNIVAIAAVRVAGQAATTNALSSLVVSGFEKFVGGVAWLTARALAQRWETMHVSGRFPPAMFPQQPLWLHLLKWLHPLGRNV